MKQLHQYACRLMRDPNVLAVVLFGSLATGQYSGSSDADILIVTRKAKRDLLSRGVEYYDPYISVPLELQVVEEKEALQSLNRGDSFLVEVFQNGKILAGEKNLNSILKALQRCIRKFGMKRIAVGWQKTR